MTPSLLAKYPALARDLPWLPILQTPTPVHRLAGVGRAWGHDRLFVKREDLTASGYGGNKLRNLEFLLGDALAKGADRLLTIAPLGSNFVAALAVQAARLRMTAEVHHFVVERNAQVDAHASFSAAHGARLRVFDGVRGVVPSASLAMTKLLAARLRGDGVYWIPPGASNVRGAMGHANAALELADQVRARAVPEPDVVFVGAGTCGTIAGLMAGFALSGMRSKVIGVRCVDRVVCHARAIARLANGVLARVGAPGRIEPADVVLEESPHDAGYARPTAAARDVIDAMAGEGITLDGTYTSKVVLALARRLRAGAFAGQSVLYWHTFSPEAIRWAAGARCSAGGPSFRAVA